ncbi:hypothetical protein EDB86DRAFT_2863378 [Lactarius hatsudake]|nr:hypothetical protein EDB86DRAFT_2863378 [Lactarius hatsudake]
MPTTRSQTAAAAAAAAAAVVAPGLATSVAPTADDLAPPVASASSLTTLTASAGSLAIPTAGSLPAPTAGNLPTTTVGSLATPAAATSTKGAKYDLWCLCKGYSKPLLVSIAPGEYLYNLMKEILRECGTESGPFKGAKVMDIVLTKIDIVYHSGEVNTSEISRRISSGDENTEVLNDPMITISGIWPTEPLPRHISIFVHLPSDTALGKRPAGGLDIHGAKNFDDPPSMIAKPFKYKSLQNHPSQRILDDRPQADSVPPLSLLYDGFGYFMDDSSLYEPICADQEQRNLESRFSDFANEMTGFYPSEDSRRNTGLGFINKLLGIELMPASIGSVRTDGHYHGLHGAAICIVEFKNEPADNGSMAMVELAGYVARSHKGSFDQYKDLFEGWNVPCLGMTVVGPFITFYGIMFLSRRRQWHIAALTPTLSCVASACEGRDRKVLCAAFRSASILLNRIRDDVDRFVETPPESPLTGHMLPYISELPRYPDMDENQKFQFQILRCHHKRDNRNLYIAKTFDDKEIVVKFTRQYSIELHNFCAERGHAPTIRGFGRIPGGWYVIAMDYISSATSPSKSLHPTHLRDKWKDDLKALVQAFHDEDLVHGDLRKPNMICNEEDIFLLDFDWGGQVGEASYPCAWLNPDLTDGREDIGLGITKDDDIRILRNTLANI